MEAWKTYFNKLMGLGPARELNRINKDDSEQSDESNKIKTLAKLIGKNIIENVYPGASKSKQEYVNNHNNLLTEDINLIIIKTSLKLFKNIKSKKKIKPYIEKFYEKI